jgi:ABC-2 type transport system permease protein
MSAPASTAWLAAHEMRLAKRDFMAMMTANRPSRETRVWWFIAIVIAILHAVAYAFIKPSIEQLTLGGIEQIIAVSALMLLPLSLMVSQAMELITRVFYSRSDLDLILASPASSRKLFVVRMASVAMSTSVISLLIAAPAINVMAVLDKPGWLLAYPVLLGLGALSTVAALMLTASMFRLIGARRTRVVAQILAAVIGAGFVIGIQIAAISSLGTISRFRFLTSETARAWLPDQDSPLWIPARAATGETYLALAFIVMAAGVFMTGVLGLAGGFADKALAAAGIDHLAAGRAKSQRGFRSHSVRSALRAKEWKLLARDPWLISQTLMQVLYLAPPAFMLWKGFGDGGAIPAVAVPVLVMAAGQLAGGLAWLAISGEDAPQLVATAPVTRGMVIRAKVEAVFGAMAFVVLPILAAIALLDPLTALVAAGGIACAAASATAIQLWFRSQAKRSNFRRRQTSTKIATFTEAFSSIFWAGAAGLAAAGTWWAVALALGALGVLAATWRFRPRPVDQFA